MIIGSYFNNLIAFTADTLRLYYDIDQSSLNSKQLQQIDAFVKLHQPKEIKALDIIAFADFLADTAYNFHLSQHRADNVKKYLASKLDSKIIIRSTGKGELPPELINQPLGFPENRRVEIIMQFQSKMSIKSVETIEKPEPVELAKAKEGDLIVLKNFNFQPGRHFLTPASQPELEVLLNSLAENPDIHIEIQGHICCEFTGKDGLDQDTYTNDLSLNRANYIYTYLIRNGISSERLSYKGYGSTKPLIYPEKTLADQDKNRRVEIVIVKK
jgi:outer membrane protein OmpA-like peptidoglycan-associated protein